MQGWDYKIVTVFMMGLFIFSQSGYAQPQDKESAAVVKANTKIEYTAEGLRDPFEGCLKEEEKVSLVQEEEKPGGPEQRLPSLTVQGIIWGGSLTQAIINNKVVKTGDTIEGAKIIKIDKDGILALYGGSQFNLSSPAQINIKNLMKEPEGGQDEEQF